MSMVLLAFSRGEPQDWAILAIIMLLICGPKHLPDLGRQLGKAMREFQEFKEEALRGTGRTRAPGGFALLITILTLSLWLGLMLALSR